MLDIQVVEDICDSRLSSWNELLDQSYEPQPFQRYEWAKNWWQNCASRKDNLFVLLAKRGEEILGIAPLMYRRNFWPEHYFIRFIGTDYFDYFDFIIKKGKEKDVVDSFIEHIHKNFAGFELELKKDFDNSPAFKALIEGIESKKFNGTVYPEDIVPFLELPGKKEQFYDQTKKSLKLDVARQERRLKELGELVFKECQTLENAMSMLEDFFNLHIKKWEFAGGYSAYKFKGRRNLLRSLLKSLFDKKIVNMYYLLLDKKRKLAICFAFKMNKRFIYYAPCYDPEFAKYSPGKVLINKLINYSIDNQYREFDFGIGNESYKLEWPSKIKKLYNVYIFPDKDSPAEAFLKLRRCVISNYFLKVLPHMRKFYFVVYLWRWLNRRRGSYERFQ